MRIKSGFLNGFILEQKKRNFAKTGTDDAGLSFLGGQEKEKEKNRKKHFSNMRKQRKKQPENRLFFIWHENCYIVLQNENRT